MFAVPLFGRMVGWFRRRNGSDDGNGQDNKKSPVAIGRDGLLLEPAGFPARRVTATGEQAGSLTSAMQAISTGLVGMRGEEARASEYLKKISETIVSQAGQVSRLSSTLLVMPEISRSQVSLSEQANLLLQRQVRNAELLLERFADLQAALKSVEQSADAHLKCLNSLQEHGEKVLKEYQTLLVKQNRRMAWLFALALTVSTLALGGIAMALWMRFL